MNIKRKLKSLLFFLTLALAEVEAVKVSLYSLIWLYFLADAKKYGTDITWLSTKLSTSKDVLLNNIVEANDIIAIIQWIIALELAWIIPMIIAKKISNNQKERANLEKKAREARWARLNQVYREQETELSKLDRIIKSR